jgi:hypothetical protein
MSTPSIRVDRRLTDDERRRGQAAGAETRRARREEAEQEAREELAERVPSASGLLSGLDRPFGRNGLRDIPEHWPSR